MTITTDVLWLLLAGFLVMFMQAGFAMLDTGMCRAKNAAHTISMNFMIYALGCLAFWVYGFALASGNWKGFFLLSSQPDVLAPFFLAMVFFSVAAAIPIGAMAERWSWKSFCLYGLWVALPYSLFASWVCGGWLARAGTNWHLGHGAVDFAGSGVVHGMGGIVGLVGAVLLGPRLGKYVGGRPAPLPGHNVPMVVLGTLILGFGWFGFSHGLSNLGKIDLQFAVVIVNTVLASIAGALGALLVLNAKRLKPDPTVMCNGFLAGLVAVSAASPFIDSWAALLIGGVAGVMVVFSVFFLEDRRIDDPVGAISVHGVCGFWGVIAVGLFANGRFGDGWNGVVRREFVERFGRDGVRGLFYGDASQLAAQLLEAGVLALFGFAMAYLWFRLSNLAVPLRVAKEAEWEGLDRPEMGALGYPDFTVSKRG